jgi:putative ABC transport system permease protein
MELKFALRSLRNRPAFALLAVAILALGIGANTAIFSVVNSVLLRPLDYRDPDRLVMVGASWNGRKATIGQVTESDFDDLHAQATVFESLAAFNGGGTEGSSVIVRNSADFASVCRVSEEFFRAMGVNAAAGRLFTPEEYRYGAPDLAVISDAFWKRRFAGDPQAVGDQLRAYGRVFTVIGVLPPGFSFPDKTDIWLGATEEKNTSRTASNWRAVGRLRSGIGLPQAQAELDTVGERLAAAYPISNRTKRFRAMPVREEMVSDVRTTLLLLLGSVALVLLIACANMANLLLARATGRHRELAVRAALGAGRARIARQLLVESSVIALLGGGGGLLLAVWGVEALVRLAPPNLPRLEEISVDGWVLAFTLAISLGASLMFGLAPALQASRVDLNEMLKQGGRGTIGSAGGQLRGALVVAEIAISMVLLVGAGLLIRSFDRLTRIELGFRPDHLLVMQTSMPAATIEAARRSNAVYGDVARQLATTPGLISASAALGLPGAPPRSNGGYWREHTSGFDQLGMAVPQANFFVIMPDYFRTLIVAMRSGRDFSDRDNVDAPLTAIVNEALVRRSFPGENPIGQRIRCGLDNPGYMTIVGVVADFRTSDPAQPTRPAIYMPYLQHPRFATRMTFVARTAGEPLALAETVRRAVRQVNPDLPAADHSAGSAIGRGGLAAFPFAAARRVRGTGCAARNGRHLRRNGVHGGAARERTRAADRARGGSRAHRVAGAGGWAQACDARAPRRRRAVAGSAPARDHALRCDAHGSRDVDRDGRGGHAGDSRRVRDPRAACLASAPARCIASGVVWVPVRGLPHRR